MPRTTRGYNPYRYKPIPREDIQEAINLTTSMRMAAEYLDISYPTFAKYAKRYNLFKANTSASGITRARKSHWTGWAMIGRPEHVKLMKDLVKQGTLEYKCYACGFDTQRELDANAPLIINFRDNNDDNYSEENMEILCYNCYFLDWDRKRKHAPKRHMYSSNPKYEIDTTDIVVSGSEEEVTGDELMNELGHTLIDLFKKT